MEVQRFVAKLRPGPLLTPKVGKGILGQRNFSAPNNVRLCYSKSIPLPPIVEVGTPVARCPPHRSRRAVFPHRALQINSLSHVPGETNFGGAVAPSVGRS